MVRCLANTTSRLSPLDVDMSRRHLRRKQGGMIHQGDPAFQKACEGSAKKLIPTKYGLAETSGNIEGDGRNRFEHVRLRFDRLNEDSSPSYSPRPPWVQARGKPWPTVAVFAGPHPSGRETRCEQLDCNCIAADRRQSGQRATVGAPASQSLN